MISEENSLRKKFGDEVMEADWELLKPHHERNALFILDSELNLIDTAINIALDRVELVKGSMNKNQIRRPKEKEVCLWDKSPNRKIGKFLIVSPYVFLKVEE